MVCSLALCVYQLCAAAFSQFSFAVDVFELDDSLRVCVSDGVLFVYYLLFVVLSIAYNNLTQLLSKYKIIIYAVERDRSNATNTR